MAQAAGAVFADYWKSYKGIVPAESLVQTEKGTYPIESYNGQVGHFLARFRRRAGCYTKSIEMVELSLKLLMAKKK